MRAKNTEVGGKNFLLKKGRNWSSFCRAVEGRLSIGCGKESKLFDAAV